MSLIPISNTLRASQFFLNIPAVPTSRRHTSEAQLPACNTQAALNVLTISATTPSQFNMIQHI